MTYSAPMRFEEKLRKQMLLKGLNQQKLARLSGVSDSEVSRILGGKSQPGLENAFKLARAVGVSLDYLADDSLESDPSQSTALPPEEKEVMELVRDFGPRRARRLLETSSELGYEVAIRRLLGAEGKPIIELPDHPRTPASALAPPPNPAATAAVPAGAGANGGARSGTA